jgi:uncharacterized membrane protein YraQ (UPF0718 family)
MTTATAVMLGLTALFLVVLVDTLVGGRVRFPIFRTAIERRSNPIFYWLLVTANGVFLYACLLYLDHAFVSLDMYAVRN